MKRKIKSTLARPLAAAMLALAARMWAQGQDDGLAQLSLEQLTQVKVVSASGYSQAPEDAPASVSIVTANDIRTFGFRTLSDILRSVRSLFVTSDRNYSSLGVRGIARPGDLNTRILLLIDGHRMNDNVYDQAMIGTEFPLDVDLIERIEVIRGPVSSLYGSNALLGVINVITRRGEGVKGGEVAVSAGSFNTEQLRLTYGQHWGKRDLLATTTLYRSLGHKSLFYPEFDSPLTNNGIADHVDHDKVHSAFLAATDGEFTFHALFGSRDKEIPTAPYGTLFDVPGTQTVDTHTLFDVQADHTLSSDWKLLGRGFYDNYHYAGVYQYATPSDAAGTDPEIDDGYGQWAGAEVKATRTARQNTVVAGFEFRDNFRQNQKTYDLNPYASDLDDQRSSYVAAPYFQFEGPLVKSLRLIAGVRYDYYSDLAGSWDPRFALVYKPRAGTVLRLTYGASFRAPTVYERFYAVLPNVANPTLGPERVHTTEALWDQQLPKNLSLATSLFHTSIHGLIDEIGSPDDGTLRYQNAQEVVSDGVESELTARAAHGMAAALSYTFQKTWDLRTGVPLSNSPQSLAKLNASAVVPKLRWSTGVDAQYVGRMGTYSGPEVSPYTLVDATLLSPASWKHLAISASAYNLLDKHYADPAPGFTQQITIPQDGRSLRLKLLWNLNRAF